MPPKKSELENRLENALRIYSLDEKQKILPLARQLHVPYRTLLRRIQGIQPRSSRTRTHSRLDKQQEEALKH